MAFDPDKFLANTGGFDPDAFLTKYAPADETTPLESAGWGAMQGVSFGFADEAEAAGRSLFDYAYQKAAQAIKDEEQAKSLGELYAQEREAVRGRYKAAEEANPLSYMAGNIAGAVAPAVAATLGTGGAAAPVAGARLGLLGKTLAGVGKAALPKTMAGLAGTGAVEGLGYSEADLTKGDIGRGAVDVGIGAAMGPAASWAAPYAGKGLAAIPRLVGKVGKETVATTVQTMLGPSRQAVKTYLEKPGAIRRALSVEDIASSLPKVEESISKRIGEYANKAYESLEGSTGVLPIEDLTNIVRNRMDDLLVRGQTFGKSAKQGTDTLGAYLADIKSLGNRRATENYMSERDLKQIMRRLDQDIDWDSQEPQIVNDTLKELRNYISSAIKSVNPVYKENMAVVDEAMRLRNGLVNSFNLRKVAGQGFIPQDSTVTKIQQLINKKKISERGVAGQVKAITGRDLVEEAERANIAKEFYAADRTRGSKRVVQYGGIGAGLGGMAGGPVGAGVGAALGGTVGAMVDVQGGPMAQKALDWWIKHKPQKIAELLATRPDAFGKYTPLIQRSIQRGGHQFAVTNFILQQREPEYRQILENLQE